MKFRLYRENVAMNCGDWRWSLIATNGRIIANGAEGYQNFGDMMKTLNSIFRSSGLRHAELCKAETEARKLHGLKPPR